MVADESDVHSCDGSIDPVWLFLAPEERESFEAWEKLYEKENFHSCRMCRPTKLPELGKEFELKKPKKLTDSLPMNLDYIRPNSTERPSVTDSPDFSEENELRKDYSQMVADESDVYSCDGSIDPVWLFLAPEERESFEAWEKLYKKENFHSCRMCRPTEPLKEG
ncbi:hypothetical protein HCN44_002046 [Aphidius gifuensis]|uniref:Uncharacterized protein n=2 Tax=Aphidius gifuensis TaxID=684658 RepID=A0A834Y3G3_APHGI|nr:hypothetical protein HCN44_002046 [Aphidius gifuensis]